MSWTFLLANLFVLQSRRVARWALGLAAIASGLVVMSLTATGALTAWAIQNIYAQDAADISDHERNDALAIGRSIAWQLGLHGAAGGLTPCCISIWLLARRRPPAAPYQ